MSSKVLDKLIVIDLEATCDSPQPAWHGEIIEVGVCLLDLQTLEITDKRGILVKPENTPITEFCTSLTTITPEMVASQGISLFKAMLILQEEYKIRKRAWGSWGDYDRNQLINECNSKRMGFPGERGTHFNIKQILAAEYGWKAGEALDRALTKFGMTIEGTQHRGVDDAVNVARIYAAHLRHVRGI